MDQDELSDQIAGWLIVGGAAALMASLFLTWSHQFSRTFLLQWGRSPQLRNVPRDPTAWQVYSALDVLLALLAVALVAAALGGGWRVRASALCACAVALGFSLHALAKPPTNGVNVFDPASSVPRYFPNSPTAGPGETAAIVALIGAMAGLLLSLRARGRSRRTAERGSG